MQCKVKIRNPVSDEAHYWFDEAHLAPFQKTPGMSDRMHASIESYIKLQLKDLDDEDELFHPDELLENLRKERPKLF
jgi:hypothetical protein